MKIRPSRLSALDLCPKYEMVDNPAVTDSGILIHEACATEITAGLSEIDKAIVEGALAFVDQQKVALAEPVQDYREIRVTCEELQLSGTVDRLLIGSDGRAIVIDFKTGVGGLPDDEDDNLQLAAYTLGVFDKFPNVHTAVSLLTNPRTLQSSADHVTTRKDISAIVSRLRTIIERADDPFSAPMPGSHCARCRHAHRCWALVPTIRTSATNVMPGLMELLRDPTVADPTPEVRSARAVLRSIMERWCDAVKDADNEHLRLGNIPPPGFKRMVRSTGLRIPENERLAALNAFRAAGIDDSVIAAGCNFALGKMTDALTLILGDKKEAAARVQGAVAGIAVEGTTEYLTRDRKGVDDVSLIAMLRKTLALGDGS